MKRLLLSLCLFPVLLVGCDLTQLPWNRGPDVKPNPQVEPIATGLRVGILYESANLPKMTASESAFIASVPLRQYLKAHCAKRADGSPDYWIVDNDLELGGDIAKTKAKNPPPVDASGKLVQSWIYVTNGKAGKSCALPKTVDEIIALIAKYEG